MALPDPERHISRLQAEIVQRGPGFLIRNVGAANPIVVAGRSLAQGETTMLAHAEQLRIGGYLLQVEFRPEDDPASDTTRMLPASPLAAPTPARPAAPVLPASPPPPAPTPAPALADRPLPATGNPFADLLGPSTASPAGSNPFADLLSPATPARASAPAPAATGFDPFADLLPPPAGVDARSSAFALAPAPAPRLPEDFDPFAPPPPATPARSEPKADPFADLGAGAAPPSIDQLFDLGPRARLDPLPAFMSDANAAAPAQAGGAGLPTDPLLLFGGGTPAAPAAWPVQEDHLPAMNAAYTPPRPLPTPTEPAATPAPAVLQAAPTPIPTSPPPPAPWFAPEPAPARAPARPAAVPAAGGTDAEAMWAAFCQGAGIEVPLPRGGGPALMLAIGQILSSAVSGTLQLMAVRASTKHELRASMTMIQPRSNNPLKFSPDAKSGIEQLVQPAARGFLEGPAAMDDAMHDLVGHSIGTVAGMRAAIEGMLDRFDPAALEAMLTRGSMLDSLLPMNRRARLWDLYLQHHKSIRDEAQEDFHNLFGKAFLSAYEQQIERLKRSSAAR
jgi:FHA domain-containing protein